MADSGITTTQITLATTNTAAMVAFYAQVFALDLQPVAMHGTTLYRGSMNQLAFVLCPNALAGVQADQSRHQFTYTVPNLQAVVARAVAAGGVVHQQTPAGDQPASIVLLDPDRNSIVFVQAPQDLP